MARLSKQALDGNVETILLALLEDGPVRLLRFEQPITIWMNGRKAEGLVTRPGAAAEHDLTGQTLEMRTENGNGNGIDRI